MATVLGRRAGRGGARRAAGLATALLLGALYVAVSAGPAWATVHCTVTGSSPSQTLTINLDAGDSVTISLSGGSDPRTIGVSPSTDPNCSGHETDDVSTIVVNGAGGNGSVTIDQGGSVPFPHQQTGTITLALGGGSDSLVIAGSSGTDTVTFGASGASLDAGQTVDLGGIGTAESVTVNGGAGDDTVSGAGGGALGAVFSSG